MFINSLDMANSGMLMFSISLFSSMIISLDRLLFSIANGDGFASYKLLHLANYNNVMLVSGSRAAPTLI